MKLAKWLDSYRKPVRAWLVLGPTILGFYPFTGLINPLWGSLAGWPLYLAARGHPVYGPHPWYEPVAFVGGPVVELLLRIFLSKWLLNWRSRWRLPLVILWLLSTLVVLPVDRAATLLPNWPVWCACE